MNDQYIYIPTPVSELPEKDGWYMLCNNLNMGQQSMYFEKSLGFKYSKYHKRAARIVFQTHWLKPILKTEYDRQIAEKAWTTGRDVTIQNTEADDVPYVDYKNLEKELQVYLNSL